MKKIALLSILMLAFAIFTQSCEDAVNSEDNILKEPIGSQLTQTDTLEQLELPETDFAEMAAGKSIVDTTTCIANTSDSLTIEINSLELAGPNPDVFTIFKTEFPIALNPGEQHCLAVRFNPPEAGSYEAKIIVNGNEDFYVMVKGTAKDEIMSLDYPEEIDFGSTNIGDIKTSEICFSNDDSTEFIIASLEVDNSAFSINDLSLPVVMPPNSQWCINVNFSPTETIQYEGLITINGDPDMQIVVKGEGE